MALPYTATTSGCGPVMCHCPAPVITRLFTASRTSGPAAPPSNTYVGGGGAPHSQPVRVPVSYPASQLMIRPVSGMAMEDGEKLLGG